MPDQDRLPCLYLAPVCFKKDSIMRLGIFAPSGTASRERCEAGFSYLRSLGVEVECLGQPWLGYEEGGAHLFSADSPQTRVNQLVELFQRDDIEAVIAFRGGYGAGQLLPLIPYNELANFKKPFMALSDGTLLLNALRDLSGIPVVHGPTVRNATSPEIERSWKAVIELFEKRTLRESFKPQLVAGPASPIEGQLVGGNLTALTHSLGTPYAPRFDGRILLLEEIKEKPYAVHRALTHLEQAGAFALIQGILLGDFIDCVHPKGQRPDLAEVFQDIFSRNNKPVYQISGVGHGDLCLPLPFMREYQIEPNRFHLL